MNLTGQGYNRIQPSRTILLMGTTLTSINALPRLQSSLPSSFVACEKWQPSQATEPDLLFLPCSRSATPLRDGGKHRTLTIEYFSLGNLGIGCEMGTK